ncbi:MAG: ABC transporter substrate-binding protein [Acidimicrobiia bacterium]|nr:ABC transporter substrate-binding protein [Acidimicrobiia bacterium]
MRIRPLILLVAFCVAATGACADSNDDGATTAGTDSTGSEGGSSGDGTSDDGPVGGGEIVIGTGEDAYETEEPAADVAFQPRAIFEGLVQMTPDYEIEPVLAESFELVEPNTWRFTLRQDVTFHDGTPFTAEAVKYSLDRIAADGGGTLNIDESSTVIVDDFTVEVTPTVPNLRLVEQLVHPSNSIVAPDSLPAEEPVGTGPFQFVSYSPQEELVVERYDDYWGEPAGVEQITFRFIPEANSRRLALESGDIDIMLDVPLDAVGAVEAAGFGIDVPEAGLYEAVYLNIAGNEGYEILTDIDVRRAVATAIDREALIEGVFDGFATDEQTLVPARLLGEEAEQIAGYEFDPAAAAELLDGAGWELGDDGVRTRDGEPLALELVNGFPSSQEHGNVAEFLQAQLAEVGIEVEIITTPDAQAYEDRLGSGQGDIWLERGNQNDANPAFLPALLFWEEGLFGNIGYQPFFAPGWPEGATENVEGPARIDDRFDEVIVEALAAPTNDEVLATAAEAMHLLIDEYAIVIPLAGLVRPVAFREGIEGMSAHPSGIQIRFDGITVEGG